MTHNFDPSHEYFPVCSHPDCFAMLGLRSEAMTCPADEDDAYEMDGGDDKNEEGLGLEILRLRGEIARLTAELKETAEIASYLRAQVARAEGERDEARETIARVESILDECGLVAGSDSGAFDGIEEKAKAIVASWEEKDLEVGNE